MADETISESAKIRTVKVETEAIQYPEFANDIGLDVLMIQSQLIATIAIARNHEADEEDGDFIAVNFMLDDMKVKIEDLARRVDSSCHRYTLKQAEVMEVNHV